MRPGELLAQRFRIERPAGAGAMGSVFRACDLEQGGAWVAVKLLPGARALPRFEREVAALAGVNHEAVVRYVAHGRHDTGDAFVAMEWIEGQSLAERLAVTGLSGLESIALAHRLMLGLGALHSAGIVHRDLKPGNVMLEGGRASAARIVDLGIARLPSDGPDLTGEGAHLGTPRYMAPEQIRNPHDVDGRADVFSLGCVLFECLTGGPAFPGDESVSVLAQVLFGHTPEASERRPELPEGLDALLETLMCRSRRRRPFATPELVAELARWLAAPLTDELAGVIARPAQGGGASASRSRTLAGTLAGETAASQHERPSSALIGPKRAAAADGVKPRRSGPPRPRGPWVGRVNELAAACARIERDRALAIWGAAGVGKTRLALEVSRAFEGLHSDVIAVFCELGEARDSADVLRIVAERAGLPLGAHAEPELVLGGLLGKLGEVLLVLDRCEHLTGELEPLISLWVENAPSLCVIATSRSRMRSLPELELGPLATRAPTLQLPAAGETLSEAAELVLARSDAAGSRSVSETMPGVRSLSPEVLAQLERIASALDGNPLAIELAAARVPVLGLAGVVARLPEQLTLLADHSASQTMRGAIAWSWELLREAERLAFMQCAVFRGSFSLAAGEAVIVAGEGETVLGLVHALREQSLLTSTPIASSSTLAVRLTLSAAVREYALAQYSLARAEYPQLAELPARHARYYAELADTSRAQAGQVRSLERAEHDNLRAAAEHLLDADDPRGAAQVLFALEPSILAAGINSPLVALLERALAAADAAPDDALLAVRARLRSLHGRLLAPAGELARAQSELEKACDEAQREGDAWLRGVTLLDLGVAYHFGRDLERAAGCYERALTALEDADDPIAEARCHGNLGAVAHDRGLLHEAADGYRQAIALLEDAAEPRLVANFRGNLALLEHELGHEQSARTLYEKASAQLEESCDARLLGIVLGNWGTLELRAERRQAAAKDAHAYSLFARAHELLDGTGDRRSLGLAAARLAAAHALAGRLDDAERHLTRAERQLRRDPLARWAASYLRVFLELARAEQAVQALDESGARAQFARAEARHELAKTTEHAGRPLFEQSDDLRLYGELFELERDRVAARVGLRATDP